MLIYNLPTCVFCNMTLQDGGLVYNIQRGKARVATFMPFSCLSRFEHGDVGWFWYLFGCCAGHWMLQWAKCACRLGFNFPVQPSITFRCDRWIGRLNKLFAIRI